MTEFYRSQSKDAPPQVLQGDFDGNGQTDYALNIIRSKNGKQNQDFIAFLNNGHGFNKHILESFPYFNRDIQTGVFLVLNKKGGTGFDHEANETFRFKADAPEIVYFEKASTAYILEKGKFRRVTTGD